MLGSVSQDRSSPCARGRVGAASQGTSDPLRPVLLHVPRLDRADMQRMPFARDAFEFVEERHQRLRDARQSSYAPGATITVTITGGYKSGWRRTRRCS
jgi:hypothetical protein